MSDWQNLGYGKWERKFSGRVSMTFMFFERRLCKSESRNNSTIISTNIRALVTVVGARNRSWTVKLWSDPKIRETVFSYKWYILNNKPTSSWEKKLAYSFSNIFISYHIARKCFSLCTFSACFLLFYRCYRSMHRRAQERAFLLFSFGKRDWLIIWCFARLAHSTFRESSYLQLRDLDY